jgi:glycosyltransferase involved in cell wall biosynthesis
MQALALAKYLSSLGHDVALACVGGSRLAQEASSQGIKPHAYLGPDSSLPWSVWRFSRLFRSAGYDIVHTHLSHDLWALVPALTLSRSTSRLVLSKHVASGVSKRDPLHRFLYRRVDAILAVSHYVAESVLKSCPVPASRVHVLANGLSLEAYDPAAFDRRAIREEFGIGTDRFVVGMIGRMTPLKGHRELLHAAAEIKKKHRPSPVFLVVGEASYGEGAYEEEVRSLATRLDLGEDVRFVGFRPDVARMLAAMDVMAFPSYEESFGVTLLEAMAMRVPVVACGSAGVLDIVKDGESGLLVPPRDAGALATGILSLLKHSTLRTSLAENARMRVQTHFTVDVVMDRLEEHYRRLLSSPHRTQRAG